MVNNYPHSFHIPVMGLGYTVDTPVKVARFGITSVVSIIEDTLIEKMREFYSLREGIDFQPIPKTNLDYRAQSITAYLDLIQEIIDKQIIKLRAEPFEEAREITKYFRMLPDEFPIKKLFDEMMESLGNKKRQLQARLREEIIAGCIDVNIMTKIDNPAYTPGGQQLSYEFSSAASALKGYAKSKLRSSIIFSAGLNPRLFSYLETFRDFFPDSSGNIKKQVILKVSDFRSAQIQGRYLAKKGIWTSEFRIESGLNCGGHAFPTDGMLLGPILQEFLEKRESLENELMQVCSDALASKGKNTLASESRIRLSVQGGIGTTEEDRFLRAYYKMDSTGWGSPFLLVPEATNVDEETLQQLVKAKKTDYYVSQASPLGIPFNNFKKSSAERNRLLRIEQHRPGSPCYLKHLAFNTEFTEMPICVSSREYQFNKIKEIRAMSISNEEKTKQIEAIEEKDCLCEGLSASALLCNHIQPQHNLKAVTICPGPNLAYFSGIFSLNEMVDHIYGRKVILNSVSRKHMFINELKMYVDYFNELVNKETGSITNKRYRYLVEFRTNLLGGIEYYRQMIFSTSEHFPVHPLWNETELTGLVSLLSEIPEPAVDGVIS